MAFKRMKFPKGITLLSDLHAEHQRRRAKDAITRALDGGDTKILCLAGDIGNANDALDDWEESSLETLLRHAREGLDSGMVTFTPGNHDYYGLPADGAGTGCLDEADEVLKEVADVAGVTFLQKNVVAFKGVALAGVTLWSPSMEAYPEDASFMNDYGCIVGFTQEACHALHKDHLKWLTGVATDPETSPEVIVTHHAPIDYKGFRSKHYTKESAPLFHAKGVARGILTHPECATRFWGFGHTHVRGGIRCGKAKVMANALGHALLDKLYSLPKREVEDFTNEGVEEEGLY